MRENTVLSVWDPRSRFLEEGTLVERCPVVDGVECQDYFFRTAGGEASFERAAEEISEIPGGR